MKVSRFSSFLGLVALHSVWSAHLAFAWPPTYGLEFNLKSKDLQAAWAARMDKHGNSYQGQAPAADGEHRIARELMEKIRQACQPDCVVSSKSGKFGFEEWQFKFKSGFSFNMSVDPATVEIQVGPWDLQTWKKYESEIQRWLFDFTGKQGFSYKSRGYQENSAHLNVGIRSAFGDDGKAFARYLADYWQYPELGSGILGDDGYNAPLLGDLKPSQREAAKKLLEGVNAKETTPAELARQIESKVYTHSPDHKTGAYHYQSVGLKYVTRTGGALEGDTLGDAPFELRANRNPVSAEQALVQLELQEKRLEHLKSKSAEPVALDLNLVTTVRDEFRSEVDQVTGFYLYLEDMGLGGEWQKYRKVLSPRMSLYEPHAFVQGKMDWSNPEMVEALDRFSNRARKSPAMMRILKLALMEPGASKNETASKILKRMSELAFDASQPTLAMDAVRKGLSPATDPLCQACLDVTSSEEWKDRSRAKKIYKKISSLTPEKMKEVTEFWSSCQAFFGLRGASP